MTALNDSAQATNLHIHRKGNSIMKFRNSLALSTTLAAAIAGMGLVTPAIGQMTANQLGTPDDGMVCRPGYNAVVTGGNFKCEKYRIVALTVNHECTNPAFPRYVIRTAGSGGTTLGQDICTKNQGVLYDSNDAVPANGEGSTWVFAAVNAAELNTSITNLQREETNALGLSARDVDVKTSSSVQHDGGNNNRTRTVVSAWYYTFAIPTGGAVSASR